MTDFGTHLETDAIVAAGMAAAEPSNIIDAGGTARIATIVVPTHHSVHQIDLDQFEEHPRRKTGKVGLWDAASFIDYVNRHKDDNTVAYGDPETFRVTALINDHGAGGGDAGWGDHRADLRLRHTPAWEHWVGKDRKQMDQTTFAEHIEDGIPEIASPPAADMLEIAQSLQAKVGVNVRQAKRLSNGETQVQWEETIEGKAGTQGQFNIPSEFELLVAPFEGGDPVHLRAKFRYRLNSGDLRLSYHLDRPDEIARTAFANVCDDLADRTEVLLVRGTPPS